MSSDPAVRVSGESARRALAFQRETVMQIAEDVIAIPQGWVIRDESMPLVWAINQLRLRQPVTFEQAVELGDRHLGDRPYRHLMIEIEAIGARLEDRFHAGGWRVDCQVTMELAGRADRVVDTSAVFEAPAEEVIERLKRWVSESEDHTPTLDELRQLERYWELEWQVRNARRLGIRGRDGSLAAITMLYSDGATAQVEDVYTVPEERGRGHARALITHAVRLAADGGHEPTFIVADDRGWPKQLYARLGFEPAGRTWAFHRDP
jgi:GNAT superfamily N-acetyltransferase